MCLLLALSRPTNNTGDSRLSPNQLVGQKLPLKLQQIWAIRIRLELSGNVRDLALFNLAIDSKLRGCDLVSLRLRDIAHGLSVQSRAMIVQQKTRQYSRIVDHWVESIKLDATQYATHTMRRTKPSLIYKKTKNLRAFKLLLGHTKLESTVRYLGIEVDDALEVSEGIDS
nr:integrase [uncultured Glaciecola sp.]